MDFKFKQDVDYTYFCHENENYSWIDHVICSSKGVDKFHKCKIIPEDCDNVSDHLPIRSSFSVTIGRCEAVNIDPIKNVCVPPNWSNKCRNVNYNDIVSDLFNNVPLLADSEFTDQQTLSTAINTRLGFINETLHTATKAAGCIPSKILKPKTFWCPELSRLRDKKRFWWSVWVSCNRPRSGVVFGIWKDLKKKFRKLSRQNIHALSSRDTNIINSSFQQRQMCTFWNKLKQIQKSKHHSNLSADTIADYYKNIMTDDGSRTAEQAEIDKFVTNKEHELQNYCSDMSKLSPTSIEKLIKSLKRGVSPGIDGISVEHLFHALCPNLCSVLADIYSMILSYSFIPDIFKTGIIIPILKKSTLDTNQPANYRPITLSCIHSKIIELIILPDNEICDSQYGFQKGRGTSFVTCLLNDSIMYFTSNGSPVYSCSLDAEKCFDNIWHSGLLYKLWDKIKVEYWLLLHRWYSSSSAIIRWNNTNSNSFHISKGMKQGSILSPHLFNLFIYDLQTTLTFSVQQQPVYNVL